MQDNVHDIYLSTNEKPWFYNKVKSLYLKIKLLHCVFFYFCKSDVNHKDLVCKNQTNI